MLNGERLITFPLTSEQGKDVCFHHLCPYSQHWTGGSSQYNRQEKEKNGFQIGKKEIKPSLFTDDTTVDVENPM